MCQVISDDDMIHTIFLLYLPSFSRARNFMNWLMTKVAYWVLQYNPFCQCLTMEIAWICAWIYAPVRNGCGWNTQELWEMSTYLWSYSISSSSSLIRGDALYEDLWKAKQSRIDPATHPVQVSDYRLSYRF